MPGFELCASVATGAAIIPFNRHNGSMRALADSLHHEEITNVRIKPTVFRRLVDALTDGEQFPAMRLLHLVGGDSIRAMMLVNRLQPRLDQPLQMGAFFAASTVAQQAAYLVQHHGYTAVSVDMAQLINDLAALSDKEAQHLLPQKEV